MPIEAIADASDPRLAPYRIVRDPELVRRSDRFLAEGRMVVRTLLASGRWPVESVLLTPPALEDLRPDLERYASGMPWYVLDASALREVGNIQFHQGCLALGVRPAPESVDAFCRRAGGAVWVGFDAVGNPDNVGAVLRSARALGADAALLSSTSCSPLYRKAIRSSMGAALLLPFLHAHEPWDAVLARVRQDRRAIWALVPDENAESIHDALAHSDPREARLLVLGAEGEGVGPATRTRADRAVRIPMRDGVDSLNVAAAAAVALYAVERHRSSVG